MSDTLRYRVPEGQDPAVVLAALVRAGYRAVPGKAPESGVLSIEYDGSGDREAVRSAIAGVGSTDMESDMEGPSNADLEPVRFTDEQ